MALPNQTTTFGVDSTAYVDVVVSANFCMRVVIQENYDSVTPPTEDLIVQQPPGATGVKVAKGTPFVFTPSWPDTKFFKGQHIGSVKTSAGSITIQQLEGQSI